ncbi:Protein of unknown function [Bacillus cereus]|nr:Protein of unknown function [Bacillus cereus]
MSGERKTELASIKFVSLL